MLVVMLLEWHRVDQSHKKALSHLINGQNENIYFYFIALLGRLRDVGV